MYRPITDSILFDLDGTLWDASAATARGWSKVAKPVSPEEIRSVSGLPFDECVAKVFSDSEKSNRELHARLDIAEREEILLSGGELYPNAVQVLKALSEQYPLYLVSNCQKWYLDSFFKHSGLRQYFTDSICHGETGKSKSENIKELIARHSIAKAVYVGDTEWDQHAAYYAGARFIFASYGFGKVNTKRCPSVASLDELRQMVCNSAEPPSLNYRRLDKNEFELAMRFYQSVDYVLPEQSESRYYGAFDDVQMVGLVRLEREHGVQVLRGMQILPAYQFFGAGSKLIRLLESELVSGEVYCIPHGWLEKFYGQIGFRKTELNDAVPEFLRERLAKNKVKFPQLILMKRPEGRSQSRNEL